MTRFISEDGELCKGRRVERELPLFAGNSTTIGVEGEGFGSARRSLGLPS